MEASLSCIADLLEGGLDIDTVGEGDVIRLLNGWSVGDRVCEGQAKFYDIWQTRLANGMPRED